MSRTLWIMLGVALVSLLPGRPPAAANISFGPVIQYATGSRAGSIVVADLNGDTKLDLVHASINGTMSVLLNNGSGGFPSHTDYPIGSSTSRDPSVGDFIPDPLHPGALDIAIASEGSNYLQIWRNNGNGTFFLNQTLPTPPLPVSTAVSDFNGDGIKDIGVSCYVNDFTIGYVSVFLGNPSGTFSTRIDSPAGITPAIARVGRFNNDALDDLAVANWQGGTVTILLGNGNGLFSPASPATYSTGFPAGWLTVADVDLDQKADVVISATASPGTFRLLQGNGNGTFTVSGALNTPGTAAMPAVADLDRDGQADLVVGVVDNPSAGVAIYKGRGPSLYGNLNAYFVPVLNLPVGCFGSVATGDLDGDGDADVVYADATGAFLNVAFNETPANAPPVAVNQTVTTSEDTAKAIALSATDVETPSLAYTVTSLPQHGTLSGTPPNLTYTPALNYNGADSFTFKASDGQLDSNVAMACITVTPVNDAPVAANQEVTTPEDTAKAITLGATDVETPSLTYTIVRAPSHGTLSSPPPAAAISFAPVVQYATGPNGGLPGAITVADLNCDGHPDLVHASVNGWMSVLLNDGSGHFLSHEEHYIGSLTSRDPSVADFNCDGWPDIAIVSEGSRNLQIWRNNGNGTFVLNQPPLDTPPLPVSTAVSDFNHDGYLDIAVSCYVNNNTLGCVSVFLGSASGMFCSQIGANPPCRIDTSAGTTPAYVRVGRFNNDLFDDLAVANWQGNTVTILLGNGNGGFAPAPPPATPYSTANLSAGLLAVADVDLDGKADIVLSATVGIKAPGNIGWFYVLQGNGDGTFNQSDAFNAPGNPFVPSVTDLDRDGRPDLVVGIADNPSVGVSIYRGRGRKTNANPDPYFIPALTLPFECFGSVATGDLNGDGLPDIIYANATLNDANRPSINVAFNTTPVNPLPTLTYTPDPDYNGPDCFTFKANDGQLDSNVATVPITVTEVNDPPLLGPDPQKTTNKNTLLVFPAADLTANGSPGPGNESDQTLTVIAVGTPLQGTAELLANGTIRYTPNANYIGLDSFSYTVQDNGTTAGAPDPRTEIGTVKVSIEDVNADTSTAVSSSANPSVNGQSVTFTATVTAVGPGVGTPMGTVTFKEGSTTLGAGALNGSGQATFATAALAVGMHTITAEYSGSAGFNPSTGTLDQTVNKADTGTSVSSSANPSVNGQSVTFTAMVSAVAPGTGTPSGTVTFKADGVAVGTGALNGSGQATFATAALTVGLHTITAEYGGNAGFNPSTGTLDQTVSKADTSTTVSSSANPSVNGQSVTFTATVTVVAPGTGTPTGIVTFKDGATTLGTGTLNASGQATFATAALTVGTHTITADYSGDAGFNASTGALPGGQTVNKADTSTTVSSSANPSVNGQSVTFTATVTAVAPGAGTPSGTVTFKADGVVLGTGALNGSGQATFATSALTVGTHTITAEYGGSAGFNGSTGTLPGGQTVNQNNRPPVVGPIVAPTIPVPVNTLFSAGASFTDPDTADTHAAVWNWGDGSTSAGAVNEATGQVTGTHAYTTPGIYTLNLGVTDQAGASGEAPPYQWIVVYDPNGGFVTGSGRITSPPGAVADRPALTGKATFGFNAKYSNGANVPNGQTKFEFKIADLDFRSNTYEWLVVAGEKAKFKGVGTINGVGSYGFQITAIDGDLQGNGGPDKFRIKIWNTNQGNAVVYDNQMGASDNADDATAIETGNIIIHKP